MIITIRHKQVEYLSDLSIPVDISIPLGEVKCFYATDFKVSPYHSENFIGSVKSGAPVNFFDVSMNPHGNGTHTECLGHITKAQESINQALQEFHFVAGLYSVQLTTLPNGDSVITKEALQSSTKNELEEAVILRTLPNASSKLKADYSGKNPPYLTAEAMSYLLEKGVNHLLVDLPSVDRELDEGALAGHHIFWRVKGNCADEHSRMNCTITELIYVPEEVEDGLYLLNIQIPSLELDAAPSKPVLYKMTKIPTK